MTETATQARKVRDLRTQLQGLEAGLEDDVVFEHIRTRRELVTIYSTQDGEPIPIPEYMVTAAMQKIRPDGKGYMFTDNPDEAPKYQQGTLKCFLHADSEERAQGILAELGLEGKQCVAGSLASRHSKRMHEQHRHKDERKALEFWQDETKEAARTERERQQLEATLSLARERESAPVATTTEPTHICDECGYEGTPNQVRGHKMGAHK
jgi:hypothetical protein